MMDIHIRETPTAWENDVSHCNTAYLLEMMNTTIFSIMFSITVLILCLFNYQQYSSAPPLVFKYYKPYVDVMSFSSAFLCSFNVVLQGWKHGAKHLSADMIVIRTWGVPGCRQDWPLSSPREALELGTSVVRFQLSRQLCKLSLPVGSLKFSLHACELETRQPCVGEDTSY